VNFSLIHLVAKIYADEVWLQNFVLCCTFGTESGYVFSASEDETVICWDVETGSPQAILAGHKSGLINLTAAENRNYVATIAGDRSAQVWRYSRRSELASQAK